MHCFTRWFSKYAVAQREYDTIDTIDNMAYQYYAATYRNLCM